MAVRIEKIVATVLDEAHRRRVEESWPRLTRGRRACTSVLLTDPKHSNLPRGYPGVKPVSTATSRPGLAQRRG